MNATPLSPYAFAKSVGKRPQMIYNYISNGMIAVEFSETGKMMIMPEEQERLSARWSEAKAKK